MPVYMDKNKRYYISTRIKDENGKSKKIMRRNKEWVGRNGKLLAQQEEIRLKNSNVFTSKKNVLIEELISKKMEQDTFYLKKSSMLLFRY